MSHESNIGLMTTLSEGRNDTMSCLL